MDKSKKDTLTKQKQLKVAFTKILDEFIDLSGDVSAAVVLLLKEVSIRTDLR